MDDSKIILYYDRAACSLGVRIALERLGIPYADQRIAIRKGEAQGEAYLKVNPAGRVPALAIPGEDSALTELVAIHAWLDATHRNAGLLPAGTMGRVRALEWLSHLATHLHASGFGPFFRPMRFIEDEDAQKALSSQAVKTIADGYVQIEARLGETPFVFGAVPGSVDYMLYVYARWGLATGIPMTERYKRLMALAARVEALAETRAALEKEGLPAIAA